MRSFLGALALACLSAAPISVARAGPPSENSADESKFRELLQDWENAVQARDLRKISEIEHDDYRNVGPGTLVSTKERDLAVIKSGTVKHVVAEFGPLDVKMLSDDVAVVQGSLTDKSSESGRWRSRDALRIHGRLGEARGQMVRHPLPKRKGALSDEPRGVSLRA